MGCQGKLYACEAIVFTTPSDSGLHALYRVALSLQVWPAGEQALIREQGIKVVVENLILTVAVYPSIGGKQ